MKILVVGGGGREHALAWKLAGDSCAPELFCAPGNAGTSALATNLNIGAEDVVALMAWADENSPDLTVVGPEVPLCAGLVDMLEAKGLKAFGPKQDAANLEGSKLFAKEVMQAGGVPTARAMSFDDAAEALDYLGRNEFPVVIKADGLAAGKGVIICESMKDAEVAVKEILVDRAFGGAGDRILVEECLVGEEVSILALVDGVNVVMLASSQDHKRAFDNDNGPNTGGMGAYSPAPIVTDELWPRIREEVFDRTLAELKRRGIVYKGILYAGLMMTQDGLRVLEFNCRFGDPETQAVLPRIDGDLVPALLACADGTLKEEHVKWRDEACVCVVMASGGYPGAYEKGNAIQGLDDASRPDGVTVFHAGTAMENDQVVTSGGRVLGVTALGKDLAEAVKEAYQAVLKIKFDMVQYRTDIAGKALRPSAMN